MAGSFFENNIKHCDKVISIGLLATTALCSSKRSAFIMVGIHIFHFSFGKFLEYLVENNQLEKGNAELIHKHCNLLFDFSMAFTKDSTQGFVVNSLGMNATMGKAASLMISRMHVSVADELYSFSFKKTHKVESEEKTLNGKVHSLFPIITAGLHIAINTIIKDNIDSYLKFPIPIGILVSSFILYNIKPENKKYSGVKEYVCTHSASVYFAHGVLNSCLSVPGIENRALHTQGSHFVSNKAKALFAKFLEQKQYFK